MVKFLVDILAGIFIVGVVNVIPSAILLLIGEAIGLTERLKDLTYKLFKWRPDPQLIYYSITLPFVIYFLSRPLEN